MGRRKDKTPETVTTGRLAWLKARLRHVIGLSKAAEDAESWSAVAALERQVLQVRNEVDSEELRLATLAAEAERAGQVAPEDLSPEEWRRYIEADAAAVSTEDLDVYMGEWLRRHGLELRPGDTAPVLVTVAA